MRYQLPDGATVSGRSYSSIVTTMAGLKLRRPRSLERYRKATARRVLDMYGITIRIDNDRLFVLDMVANGMMKRLS